MVTIRCTQKLLRRVQIEESPPSSDTLLSDWYANLLFTRPEQLILCVSERTLLPIVVTARTADTLGARLAESLQQVLLRLGMSMRQVEAERAKMIEVAFARTRNKRVLGTLNDFMFRLSWHLHDNPAISLLDASLWLAETPCGSIDYESPDKLTAQLFADAERIGARVQ